ncbi:hypothetical protein [Novosphingobium sp. BL-52-GroH]|uniref:hypothetical protein n=1 Tax=Novosphingobium sp. BL-52-GroH TaxID=3349877 RepID=UPI00384BB01E
MRHLNYRSLAIVAALPLAVLGGPVLARDAAPAGCKEKTRACLESVARSYIDALVSHDGSKIPLTPDVRRTEQGLTNAKGEHEVRESFVRTNMVESTTDVRLYTDVAKGEVIAFFLLNVDLKEADANATTKAGDTDYKVAVTKPAGTYTVHEAERFGIVGGKIREIEIIAHVEDGKGQGSGWPVERDAAVKGEKK